MRVVVVGAGVAGLATAVGLVRAGHDVAVLERADALRTGGGAVTLSSGGTAALAVLGVRADGLGVRLDELDLRADDGRLLLRADLGGVGRRLGHPLLSVPRGVLLQRLAGLLPAGVLQLARTWPDGTVPPDALEPPDVVVGADGARSAVRSGLAPELARPTAPRRTGWVTWQGFVRVATPLTSSHRVLMAVGPAGFCDLQPAGDGLLQWSFSVRDDAGVDGVAALRSRFGRWADPVPQVLAALTDDAASSWPHLTQRVRRRWGTGTTTLVGDAARTMPPSLGQGVNQALEDAHALVQALSGPLPGQPSEQPSPATADVAGALRRYETRRARQVLPVALAAGSEVVVTHRAAVRVLLRALPGPVASRVFELLVRTSSSALAG